MRVPLSCTIRGSSGKGLVRGSSYRVKEWGRYPAFPLVVDAYNQVPEENEGNNVVVVDPSSTATPSSSYRSSREAVPMGTLPVLCTPRPPAPTLTPSGPPPLPDLVVSRASWDRLLTSPAQGGEVCWPVEQPRRFTLTVHNQGNASADWFSIAGAGAAWRIRGLAAGAEVTLRSEPRFLPDQVMVDSSGEVEESGEENNAWTLPPGGTPTPSESPPETCEVVPTRTPSVPTSTPSDVAVWLPAAFAGE